MRRLNHGLRAVLLLSLLSAWSLTSAIADGTPVQKNTGGPAAKNPCDGASPLDNGSDPVNGATGNEYLQQTDYQAANASLTFRRYYNSALGVTPTPQTTPVGIA